MPPGGHPPKYLALQRYLEASTELEVTLTFAEVEAIIGTPLPKSAWERPQWWVNRPQQGQARAWLTAGWRTRPVNRWMRTVTFVRMEQAHA
jgi:hypothetical protein